MFGCFFIHCKNVLLQQPNHIIKLSTRQFVKPVYLEGSFSDVLFAVHRSLTNLKRLAFNLKCNSKSLRSAYNRSVIYLRRSNIKSLHVAQTKIKQQLTVKLISKRKLRATMIGPFYKSVLVRVVQRRCSVNKTHKRRYQRGVQL